MIFSSLSMKTNLQLPTYLNLEPTFLGLIINFFILHYTQKHEFKTICFIIIFNTWLCFFILDDKSWIFNSTNTNSTLKS